MSINLNLFTFASELKASYQKILNGDEDTNWVLYGYDKGTNDLKVVGQGGDGLEELYEEFEDDKVLYAFARITDPNTQLPKFILISWCGESSPVRRKGLMPSHLNDVQTLLKGYHVQINARDLGDVEPAQIMKKVDESSGSKYSYHDQKRPAPPTLSKGATSTLPTSQIPTYTRTVNQGLNKNEVKPPMPIRNNNNNSSISSIQNRFINQDDKFEKERKERIEQERFEKEFRNRANQKSNQSWAPNRQQWEREDDDLKTQLEQSRAQRGGASTQSFESDTPNQFELDRKKQEEEREKERIELKKLRDEEQQRRDKEERESELKYQQEQDNLKQQRLQEKRVQEEEEQRRAQEEEEQEQKRADREKERAEQRELEEQQRLEEQERYQQEQEKKEEEKARRQEQLRREEEEALRKREEEEASKQREKEEALKKSKVEEEKLSAAQQQGISPQFSNNEKYSAIVLYDYSALDDSEIDLIEGELVIGIEKLDEGWWQGCNEKGKFGLFPANYVEEVENLPQQTQDEVQPEEHLQSEDHIQPQVNDSQLRSAITLYDYAATDEGELSFGAGEEIKNIEFVSDDWWQGVNLNQEQGLFPANYVELQ